MGKACAIRDFQQQRFNRSDPTVEEALCSSWRCTTSSGSVGDASIINAPSSTKNAKQQRDPEMHQTKLIKRVFCLTKVHYRGQEKNAHRPFVTCALANLFMVRHHWLKLQGPCLPDEQKRAAKNRLRYELPVHQAPIQVAHFRLPDASAPPRRMHCFGLRPAKRRFSISLSARLSQTP